MKALLIIIKLVLYLVIALTLSYYNVPLLILIIHMVITAILIVKNQKEKMTKWQIAKNLLMTYLAIFVFLDTSSTMIIIYLIGLPYWLVPKNLQTSDQWLLRILTPIINPSRFKTSYKKSIAGAALTISLLLVWPSHHLAVLISLYGLNNDSDYRVEIKRGMSGFFMPSEFSKTFRGIILYDLLKDKIYIDRGEFPKGIRELSPSYQGIHYSGRMILERHILVKI